MNMICKNKYCHNNAAEGEKYCKYHLAKKYMTNRKMLEGAFMVGLSLIFVSSKFIKNKKKK